MKGRFHSYINSAQKIINQYKGDTPLAIFLKDFFKKDSKYGSRDRKTISSICYAYYRVGKAFSNIDSAKQLLYSYFLCNCSSNEIINDLGEEWSQMVTKPINEKIDFLQNLEVPVSLKKIFSCADHLGNELIPHQDEFISSHLIQPDLFLRIRPGKKNYIEGELKKNKLEYQIDGDALKLQNGTDISSIFRIDEDVVVQDYSSQQTGKFLTQAYEILNERGMKPIVWDCCAASGGKSLMAVDLANEIELAVSDIRKNILVNLADRFTRARIQTYHSFVHDLLMPLKDISRYNLIIADVPCSGSGTWGRTPEEMFFFDEKKLEEYSLRQKKIMDNILTAIHPGTLLIYITCSVYKDENENITEYILQNSNLQLIRQEYIQGFTQNADTMFAALFIS